MQHMSGVWLRRGGVVAGGVAALMLLAAGTAAAKGTLVPAKTTAVDGSVVVEPGGVEELRLECPKGHFLNMVHSLTAESPTSLPSAFTDHPQLRVVSQTETESGVRFTIENSGTVDAIDSNVFSVSTRIECVKERVRSRGGAASFVVDDPGSGELALAPGQRGDLDIGCRDGVPVGFRFDLTDLAFAAEEYQRSVTFERGGIRFTAGNPANLGQTLDALVGCVKRTASSPRADRARVARRASAKPKVFAATEEHAVPAHASADERSTLAARCPKRTTAVSYGWDANDADGVDLFLRGFELDGRRAAVAATNFGPDPQAASVTAICLAMKFRG